MGNLLKAESELAYVKALPISMFHPIMANGQILKHSVDVKIEAIQLKEAEVARCKVLATKPKDSK